MDYSSHQGNIIKVYGVVTDKESQQAKILGRTIGGVISAVVVITGTVCIVAFIIKRRKGNCS